MVFGQEYADVYDTLYGSKDYSAECDQIEWAIGAFGRPKSTSILDLGCGTGGHAYQLAERGYSVTGIDQSAEMIRLAREKDFVGEPAPTFAVGDIASVRTGCKYDSVTMMFAVLGYLTSNEDLLAGLATVRDHLSPGGVFLADFWYGPGFLSDPPAPKSQSLEMNGRAMTRSSTPSIDWGRNVCVVDYLLAQQRDGTSGAIRERHSLRYFFIPELELALNQVGLQLCQISDALNWRAPLDHRVWSAALVARRS